MEPIQIAIRGLQLLWIIILTGLVGNVIASFNDNTLVSAAAVNFSMFVIVLSWLVTLYGLACALAESLAIPVVVMASDAALVLFTFIDAVVLAALLGVPKCATGANEGNEKKCRELQASTTFMWFLFVTSAASLAMALLGFRRAGGSVRSAPMAQVRVGA